MLKPATGVLKIIGFFALTHCPNGYLQQMGTSLNATGSKPFQNFDSFIQIGFFYKNMSRCNNK